MEPRYNLIKRKTEQQGGDERNNFKKHCNALNPSVGPDWVPPSVVLSTLDRAKQLDISRDRVYCFGCDGGYRMVRATHGVHCGVYYWEAVILHSQERAHYRIGWSTRFGELQAPVGFDKHGFGYRDVNGASVHASIRNDKYGEPYGVGDVIGCFIRLDEVNPASNEIRFFKNGRNQGVAYSGAQVPNGIYYPAVSIYQQGVVFVNFGPSFLALSPDIKGSNGVSEVQPMNPADRKEHEMKIIEVDNLRKKLLDERVANDRSSRQLECSN